LLNRSPAGVGICRCQKIIIIIIIETYNLMAPLQLMFRGKAFAVTETTMSDEIIDFLVNLNESLGGGDLELRLCMV
jgi:hypothetical protein